MLLATAFLAACDDPPPRAEPRATAIPRWDAPRAYDFVVRQSCGEQNFVGTFRISVRDGQVEAVEPRDKSARAALEYMRRDEVPALDEIVELARQARASGADVAEVAYHEDDGHPERVDIDHRMTATDDKSCYVVRDYARRSNRSTPTG